MFTVITWFFRLHLSAPLKTSFSWTKPPQSSSLLMSHWKSFIAVGTQKCASARRKTQGQPSTHPQQRGGRRSSKKSRLHHAKSSEFATDRYSISAARPHSKSSTADAQLQGPVQQRQRLSSRLSSDWAALARCNMQPEWPTTGDGDGRLCLLFFIESHWCLRSRVPSVRSTCMQPRKQKISSPPRQLERRLQRALDHDSPRSLSLYRSTSSPPPSPPKASSFPSSSF